MKVQRSVVVAVAVVFGLALTTQRVSAQEVAPEPEYAGEACTITVNPETVVPGEEAAAVEVKLSTDIGEVSSATAAEGSGIAVESVEQKDGQTVELSLNTASAAPGEWGLSVEGESGACTGQVTIGDDTGGAGEAPAPEGEGMSHEGAPSDDAGAETPAPTEQG